MSTSDILLVEDNPQDVELALRAFKKSHVKNRVVVARDGEEALRLLYDPVRSGHAAHTPKVVFLDLKLPKLSGLEVLRAIRSTDTTKRVPVVILTSSREERDIMASYEIGANGYVVKPLESQRFVECVSMLGTFWTQFNITAARQ